jgi:hypothetical protein
LLRACLLLLPAQAEKGATRPLGPSLFAARLEQGYETLLITGAAGIGATSLVERSGLPFRRVRSKRGTAGSCWQAGTAVIRRLGAEPLTSPEHGAATAVLHACDSIVATPLPNGEDSFLVITGVDRLDGHDVLLARPGT